MKIETLKFWCQKVLPLVYDDSLSYYELLNKVVDRINEIQTIVNNAIDEVETLDNSVETLSTKIDNVETYVNNYFNTLDLTTEVSNVITQMVENGELSSIVANAVGGYSTPVFVERMNDMNDPKRIYVLTSNKHIYQSINGVFFDTGVEYGNSNTLNQEFIAPQNGQEIIMYTEGI
jgi:hypothetical protein